MQGRLRWGAGGARITLHTELFPFLLSTEEAFSGIVDSFIQENCSGGKPPDPQIIVVLLGDQCIKHCSSGKEYGSQNLASVTLSWPERGQPSFMKRSIEEEEDFNEDLTTIHRFSDKVTSFSIKVDVSSKDVTFLLLTSTLRIIEE